MIADGAMGLEAAVGLVWAPEIMAMLVKAYDQGYYACMYKDDVWPQW